VSFSYCGSHLYLQFANLLVKEVLRILSLYLYSSILNMKSSYNKKMVLFSQALSELRFLGQDLIYGLFLQACYSDSLTEVFSTDLQKISRGVPI